MCVCVCVCVCNHQMYQRAKAAYCAWYTVINLTSLLELVLFLMYGF